MSTFLSEPLSLFWALNTPYCLVSSRLPVLCPGLLFLLPFVHLGLLAYLMMRLMYLNMFLMEVFSF